MGAGLLIRNVGFVWLAKNVRGRQPKVCPKHVDDDCALGLRVRVRDCFERFRIRVRVTVQDGA